MTLAEAVQKFETMFEAVNDEIGCERAPGIKRDWSRAPSGDRYVTLTNGGIKPEGAPFPASSSFEDEAIANWFAEAISYAAGRKSLYWRDRPQIDWSPPPLRRCFVYSRMVAA